MTIAAGFVHRDGVLLCSDLLVQDDYAKELGFKILDLEGKWGTGLAAFAGTVDYAVSAIQRFDRKLKKTAASRVVETLEELLYEHYSKHVLSHPEHSEGTGPDYDLLFAIRPEKEKARLYVSSGSTLHEVASRFRCIGSGQSLATYLLRPYLLRNMQEQQVLCLASYALANVKRSIVGCGGLSMFMSLRNDGTFLDFLGTAMHKFVESIAQEFDRDVDQAFVSTFCDTDKNFEWNAKVLKNKLLHLRARWLKAQESGIATTIDEIP
jgi:ATP-dependent protease HslVU (ClpYQ) peptidase subunit